MKTMQANEDHKAFYNAATDLIKTHLEKMPAEVILAILSNMVGKVIAMQDQRTMTPDRAIELVQENIERGNLQALEQLNPLDISEIKPS